MTAPEKETGPTEMAEAVGAKASGAPGPPDVLPPLANRIMAVLWIALFGGRWIVLPFLIFFGLLSPVQVTEWDNGILLIAYLALLAVTLLALALRWARGLSARASAAPASPLSSERRTGTRD